MTTITSIAAATDAAEAAALIDSEEGAGIFSQGTNFLSAAISSEKRVITSREARVGALVCLGTGYVTGAKVANTRRDHGKAPLLSGWGG
jgi:hypothetical protein